MRAGQIAEAQIRYSDADETLDAVSDCLKHATDLSIEALAKDDAQSRGREQFQSLDFRAFAVEKNSFRQFRKQSRVQCSIECDLIFLVDLVTGMGQSLGQVPVVCEKEQAFSLGIEPADVKKMRKVFRKQIENCVARVHITTGRDEPRRFMQHDRVRCLGMQEAAIDLDVIALARLRAEIGADLAVNGDAAVGDELVAMSARTNPGGSEEAIEAHVEALKG